MNVSNIHRRYLWLDLEVAQQELVEAIKADYTRQLDGNVDQFKEFLFSNGY